MKWVSFSLKFKKKPSKQETSTLASFSLVSYVFLFTFQRFDHYLFGSSDVWFLQVFFLSFIHSLIHPTTKTIQTTKATNTRLKKKSSLALVWIARLALLVHELLNLAFLVYRVLAFSSCSKSNFLDSRSIFLLSCIFCITVHNNQAGQGKAQLSSVRLMVAGWVSWMNEWRFLRSFFLSFFHLLLFSWWMT